MARPKRYDDRPLLATMAEILAFPEFNGVRTKDEAMRQAIAYIEGSDRWPPNKHAKVVERLKKAYAKDGAELEAAARQRPSWVRFPYLPPQLINMPADPEATQTRAEARELIDGLRDVAQWATDLAGILDPTLTPLFGICFPISHLWSARKSLALQMRGSGGFLRFTD